MVVAAVLALAPLGLGLGFTGTAGASGSGDSPVILSFDFSDNSQAASVSGGGFNIIADVLALSGQPGGDVRMVAIAPASSGSSNLVCGFQAVQHGQVECAFNFSAAGEWRVRAVWVDSTKDPVGAFSQTVVRVSN